MTITGPSLGSDYTAMVKHGGGGKKGRVCIPPGYPLKLAIYRAGLELLAGGEEAHFYRRIPGRSRGRFSDAAFRQIVTILDHYLPDEMDHYVSGRYNPDHLIGDRFHKMYYGTKGNKKSRGEASREHPSQWSRKDRIAAETRLEEVGFPY